MATPRRKQAQVEDDPDMRKVTFNLRVDQIDALARITKETDAPTSAQIRRAVDAYLQSRG